MLEVVDMSPDLFPRLALLFAIDLAQPCRHLRWGLVNYCIPWIVSAVQCPAHMLGRRLSSEVRLYLGQRAKSVFLLAMGVETLGYEFGVDFRPKLDQIGAFFCHFAQIVNLSLVCL